MESRGEQPTFPPLTHAYLVDWWRKVGLTASGGMSESALEWREISAWRLETDTDLEPWEAEAIQAMSQAFVSERHGARKPGCPAPYSLEAPDEAKALDQAFSGFFAAAAALANTKP